MSKNFYANLAKFGFIGGIASIFISLLIFNHYWQLLGINPKTEFLPNITQNYEEFKDYVTLLFALLSAVGSLLSSLLIILFYGAWKEQHSKSLIAQDAKKAFSIIHNERNLIQALKFGLDEELKTPLNRFTVTDHKQKEIYDNLVTLTTENITKLGEFIYLTEGQTIFTAINSYRQALYNFSIAIKSYSHDLRTYNEVEEEYRKLLKEVEDLNAKVLNLLKGHIFIE